MTEIPVENGNRSPSEEIHTEIKTDVDFEGEGTVYAIETVQQGDRRLDWKMSHIDGTYAEGFDYYYKGELFKRVEFEELPQDAPSGRYKDDRFHELLDGEVRIEDGRMIETKEYDAEGVDTTDWAIRRFGGSIIGPQTILEEWYESYKEDYEAE